MSKLKQKESEKCLEQFVFGLDRPPNDSVTLLPCQFNPHSLSNKYCVQTMFLTPYIGMASPQNKWAYLFDRPGVAGAVLQTAVSLTV